jgi:signal transduction histidine kinase
MASTPPREESTTGLEVDPLAAAFRTLAEHVEVGVVVVNAAGAPLHVNRAGRLLLGGRDAPVGSDPEPSLPGELRAGAEGGRESLEFDVPVPDAPRPRRVRATRIPIRDERGAIVLLEDVAMSEAARLSLELASRLRTWALFRVVHSLKQPLNVLSLQLELLKQPADPGLGADAPTVAECATKAQNEVLRFGRELDVIASLLAPPEGGAPAAFDVGPFLVELAQRLASAMQVARVRLLTEVPETPLPALARRTRVQQALLNVLQNALDVSPRGGTVRLSARVGEGVVVITVKDEGPGMSPKHLARAFDLYYSTRPGATGIGLTVARTLLASEGGHIVLASRPSEGTTAEISIPHG